MIGCATLTLTHFLFFFFACCAAAAALLSVDSPRGRLAAGGGTAMFSRSVRASKVCCCSPCVFLEPFFNEGIVSLSAASSFLSCAESRSVQCSESCEDIISTNASVCSRLYCVESDTPPFAPYKKVIVAAASAACTNCKPPSFDSARPAAAHVPSHASMCAGVAASF